MFQVEPLDIEKIRKTFLSSDPYTILTYKDAVDILTKAEGSFKVPPSFEEGLAKEHELFLVKQNNDRPIFVTDWPTHLKAFYMKESKESSTVSSMSLC